MRFGIRSLGRCRLAVSRHIPLHLPRSPGYAEACQPLPPIFQSELPQPNPFAVYVPALNRFPIPCSFMVAAQACSSAFQAFKACCCRPPNLLWHAHLICQSNKPELRQVVPHPHRFPTLTLDKFGRHTSSQRACGFRVCCSRVFVAVELR